MLQISPILLGFFIAMMVVMTGVGGGCLMAPALVFGMGMPMPVAVGTDLLYSTATKLIALGFYWRRGLVRWRIAGWMLVGSLPAAALALGAVWWLRPNNRGLTALMSAALAAALALSAGAILMRERRCGRRAARDGGPLPRLRVVGVGAGVGALVSLSSVGAGAIGVAALLLVCSGLDLGEVIGTDLAHGVALAAVAAAGHTAMGNADLPMLVNLLIGVAPGIWLGGRLAVWLPEAALRRTISLLLLGTAVRLIA